MSNRRLALLGAAVGVIALWLVPVAGQTPASALRTPWGAPDLQGIWDNQVVTPFERPKELGTREFLTEQERAAQEQKRLKDVAANPGRDQRAVPFERDVAGPDNASWQRVRVTKEQ